MSIEQSAIFYRQGEGEKRCSNCIYFENNKCNMWDETTDQNGRCGVIILVERPKEYKQSNLF